MRAICGYSDFEISADVMRCLTIRIEVFPSKITYKEDYQKMIDDISEMVSEISSILCKRHIRHSNSEICRALSYLYIFRFYQSSLMTI